MIKLLKAKTMVSYFWMALGVLALAVAWQVMSLVYSPVFVPSPGETLTVTIGLFTSPNAIADLYHTFYRVLIALGLLAITGIAVGMLAGFNPWLEQLIKPVKDILIAIPPVALTLLVIFLFGGGSVQTVAIAVALGFPLLYGGTVTAVRSVDRDLLEMLGAFKVSKAVQLREGYLPAVIFAVLPNILLAAGLTVRLMIMAEIIVGLNTGIGQALSIARVHMATGAIFAWMLVMATAVLIIEGGLLHLARKHLLTWQAGR
ncbi:MAG: ABC transporter permease subunit [Bacillota bacterium]